MKQSARLFMIPLILSFVIATVPTTIHAVKSKTNNDSNYSFLILVGGLTFLGIYSGFFDWLLGKKNSSMLEKPQSTNINQVVKAQEQPIKNEIISSLNNISEEVVKQAKKEIETLTTEIKDVESKKLEKQKEPIKEENKLEAEKIFIFVKKLQEAQEKLREEQEEIADVNEKWGRRVLKFSADEDYFN